MFNFNNCLISVIYDGIQNAVFESQVVAPLLQKIKENPELVIFLISFEKQKIPDAILLKVIPASDQLHVIIAQRLPYLGRLTLFFAGYKLKKILKYLPPFYHLIARGPLAGFMSLWALERVPQRDSKPAITIQARGLCAEEYRFAKSASKYNIFQRWYYKAVYATLKNIEQRIYGPQLNPQFAETVTIEAVSPALKQYLITDFGAQEEKIVIATQDIPEQIDSALVAQWRTEVRTLLSIREDAVVYCYNGSDKPWQCISRVISYFKEQVNKDSKSYLLILTADKKSLTKKLEKARLDKKCYSVAAICYHDVYRYLAAADYGFLFRDHDVVNWVSRPTKMLEYQAVGLKLIHNNTIAWLTESR